MEFTPETYLYRDARGPRARLRTFSGRRRERPDLGSRGRPESPAWGRSLLGRRDSARIRVRSIMRFRMERALFMSLFIFFSAIAAGAAGVDSCTDTTNT